jgi:hypothetical protein
MARYGKHHTFSRVYLFEFILPKLQSSRWNLILPFCRSEDLFLRSVAVVADVSKETTCGISDFCKLTKVTDRNETPKRPKVNFILYALVAQMNLSYTTLKIKSNSK